jgi:hypothetical protein
MSRLKTLGGEESWSRSKRAFFWLHYSMSWVGVIGFGYMILAPLFGEGLGHIVAGIFAALFFRTGQFAWTNGTVIVVSALYLAYSVIAVLPRQRRWKRYGYLADLATLLAVVYINLNVHQLKLIMLPVSLWWIVHRWIAHFSLRAS